MTSTPLDDLDTGRQTIAVDRDLIVLPFAGGRPVVGGGAADFLGRTLMQPPSLDPIEQRLRLRVAERAFVAEQDQLAGGHLAARGGAVMVEHVAERLPQQFEIVLGETGALDRMRGQWRGDIAVRAVE